MGLHDPATKYRRHSTKEEVFENLRHELEGRLYYCLTNNGHSRILILVLK